MFGSLQKIFLVTVITVGMTFSFASEAKSSGKTIGVRANILPLLIGLTDLNVDIALGKIVISPNMLSWGLEIDPLKYTIAGFGLDVNYHFSGGLSDGWYLGVGYKSLAVTVEDDTTKGELATSGFSAQGGYSWVWSLMYMNLGVQVASYGDSEIVLEDKDTGLEVETKASPVSGAGLTWSIGFAF